MPHILESWLTTIPPWKSYPSLSAEAKSELVSLYFAFMIALLRIQVGKSFPYNEVQLANLLHTSRDVIHRAWTLLKEHKLVDIERGRGVVVKSSPGKLLLGQEFAYERLLEIRKHAEMFLAYSAATKRLDTDIEKMNEALRQQEKVVSEVKKLIQVGHWELSLPNVQVAIHDYFVWDLSFHVAFRAAAHDPWVELIDEIASSRIYLVRLGSYSDPNYILISTREHAQILSAIKKKKPTDAALTVKQHLETAYKFGKRYLEEENK